MRAVTAERWAGSGFVVACVTAFALAACGRTTEPPPSLAPAAAPVPPVTSSTAAARAGAPDAPTATHAETPDPLRPMTPEEESSSMPKPGQANDHSNPAAEPTVPRSEPAR